MQGEGEEGSILVPNKDPGIYIVKSFSGNIFYGTQFPLAPESGQPELVEAIDFHSNWNYALGNNLAILTIDYISAFFVNPGDECKESFAKMAGDLVEFALGLHTNAAKVAPGLALAPDQSSRTETASSVSFEYLKTLLQIFITQVIGLLEETTECALSASKEKIKSAASKYAKFALKALDIFGRVSSGVQAVERTGGVFGGRTYAVERNLVVIGEPFEARITEFSPPIVRRGDEVILKGLNLFDINGDPRFQTVQLCAPDNEDGEAGGNLAVEVLSQDVENNQIKVKIPFDLDAVEGHEHQLGWCLHIREGLKTSTHTDESIPKFVVRKEPEIKGVILPLTIRDRSFLAELSHTGGLTIEDIVIHYYAPGDEDSIHTVRPRSLEFGSTLLSNRPIIDSSLSIPDELFPINFGISV